MDRKKRRPDADEPSEEASAAAATAAPALDREIPEDLRGLLGQIRKRDRQLAIARLLVDEYARVDGEDPDLAWTRHCRSLEIVRASAVPRSELKKTDLGDLVAEIDARMARG